MGNVAVLKIDKCTRCPHCSIERILTPDSFEHETGVFCGLASNPDNEKEHRLVVADDYDVERWALVPDWCPLIIEDLKDIYRGLSETDLIDIESKIRLDRANRKLEMLMREVSKFYWGNADKAVKSLKHYWLSVITLLLINSKSEKRLKRADELLYHHGEDASAMVKEAMETYELRGKEDLFTVENTVASYATVAQVLAETEIYLLNNWEEKLDKGDGELDLWFEHPSGDPARVTTAVFEYRPANDIGTELLTEKTLAYRVVRDFCERVLGIGSTKLWLTTGSRTDILV